MARAIVGTWGKNLAIRFPAEITEAAGVRNGERVEVENRNGTILIRRETPRVKLTDLFKGKSAKTWRAEYDKAFDWGSDVGREVVDE